MTIRLAATLLLTCAGMALALPAAAQDYDVLVRGGTVYDGTGAAGRIADVAVKGDRIVAVGPLPANATATTVIDAKGRIVAPGFIDPHSHAGTGIATPALAPALPILYQGITTIAVNPDGGGSADLAQQIATLKGHPPGVNVIPLIGHNAVRQAVMGIANRKATPDEQARMEGLVTAAMRAGAYGLSSGPFYVPGKYSDTAEIVGLAKAAARFPGAFHISHIRDESNYDIGVVAAVDEVIAVSRASGIPGVVTHIKALGKPNWGKSAEVIAHIDAARKAGLSIWADQYPYEASGSSLQASLVPGWAQEGGAQALADRLRDPSMRARIRAEMIPNMERRGGPGSLMIRRHVADASLEGKRLDAIAKARGEDPLDTAIAMLIAGGASTVSFNMSDPDIAAFMRQPWTMTSTDGDLVAFGEGAQHPRSYGAFPRKLRRYVLDTPVIPMAQAIHAATGLTAQVLGVPDRGVLKPGMFADVIVFDPKIVGDTATYERPHSYAVGMTDILINGRPALRDGKPLPALQGRLLLRTVAP